MPAVSKERLARLARRDALAKIVGEETPKEVVKDEPAKLSTEMSDMVVMSNKVADSAIKTALMISGVLKENASMNKRLIQEVIDIVTQEHVVKLKINRNKDLLMTDIDIIRIKR